MNSSNAPVSGPSMLAPPAGPPHPKGKYSPKNALDDIPRAHHALNLFMASHMVESEGYCKSADPKMERLFTSTGYGVIQAVKAMMSFEDSDLLSAIEGCKRGLAVAQAHRKRAPAFTTRLAGLVTGSSSGTAWIKSMNAVERHAELVYAETLFEKALLGILYSGDWLAFIKEALNLRSTMNIYHTLGKFVTEADAAHPSKHDPSLDIHFRSGVCLGNGASHLVMSMMPARLQTIVELLGYSGDRATALKLLSEPGGWTADSDEPAVSAEQEGIRRTICDIFLLVFHLVLSSFTADGVDIKMADKIVRWNLKRYPNGIVFRFGEGRLAYRRAQPVKAIAAYGHATSVQEQFRSLQNVSYWEMAVANFALWDVPASRACWRKLVADATWSKAVYTYGLAVCLLEETDNASREEAHSLLVKVPELRQRIAGKSIPLEKFVARRAQRFVAMPARTPVLPALEIAYVLGAVTHAPRAVLVRTTLPLTRAATDLLSAQVDKKSEGYWDDRSLARFLQGVCALYIAHPDPEAVPEEDEAESELSKIDAEQEAKQALEEVLSWGPKIETDHHLIFHAHYELGRLLACNGDKAGAKTHFEVVASGKPVELAATKRTGKYSMENLLTMRNHAALEALDKP